METNKLDNALDQLTQHAASIARSLPEERRQEMHHDMLSKELNTFVRKVHFVNQLFGGMSESAKIGIVVDELFYEVHLSTKEFETEAQANDYAQIRSEEVKKSA